MQYTNFQTSGAVTNDPIPDKIPVELASLTFDEVRIISRICPFLKVVILPGGQFGEEGSVIHFPFPVQKSDESSAPSIERVRSDPISCAGLSQYVRDISNYAGTNQPRTCASSTNVAQS